MAENSTEQQKPPGRPFVKGDPRINRAGRPKEFSAFVAELRDGGHEERALEFLHEAMGERDKDGTLLPMGMKASELILAYTRGRPVQSVHTVGVNLDAKEDLSKLTPDELRQYLAFRQKTTPVAQVEDEDDEDAAE